MEEDSGNLVPLSIVVKSCLGPMVVGTMIEQFLLGIICFQAAAYFRHHFSNDTIFCRSVVTCLVVFTIFLGILDFAMLYRNLVCNYGDSEKFEFQGWMAWIEPSLTAWIAFVAHIFYIFRCWAVTRSLVVCISLGVVVLNALVSGIMYTHTKVFIIPFAVVVHLLDLFYSFVQDSFTVFCFSLGRLSRIPEAVIPSILWFVSTAICDLGIATVLVFYLWRKESVLRSNSAMISRLQRTSFETGLLTAICALSNLFLFLFIPDKGYHIWIHYSVSHLYTLSVLYTLLSREYLRNILHEGLGTFVSDFQSSFLAAGVLSATSLDNHSNGEALRQRGQSSNVCHV